MNKLIFTKEDMGWGRNTQIKEIEKVISSNTNSLTDGEIKTMLGENDSDKEGHRDNGNHKR